MSVEHALIGQTPWAVVDVETTGVYAGGHDRIIEIAVLRVLPDGTVEDEYATLVNPRRDVGRTDIHGITAGELQHAPDFAEVAGDIAHRLQNAIIVGHNVRFDLDFLRAEFQRIGVSLPRFPSLCTLHLAHRMERAPSRNLRACCAAAGIAHDQPHTALGDAHATARLLARYVERAADSGWCRLGDFGCEHDLLPAPGWVSLPPSGRSLRRTEAAHKRAEARGYLAQLISRLPGTEGSSAREAEYLCLIDRILEDRALTPAEAQSLFSAAASWGMGQNDANGAHRAYVWALARQAQQDGVVTDLERQDLLTVCELLAVPATTLTSILDSPPPAATCATDANAPCVLAGKSVCFTGELLGSVNGQRVTRQIAEQHAVKAGLLVHPGVTKGLDILVVADPDTQSGKAKKARGYGTRIMAEIAFWQALGINVE